MADVNIDETELEQLRARAAAADSAAAAAEQAAADADAARADIAAGVELLRTTLATSAGVDASLLPGATFADVQASADRARAIAEAARGDAAKTTTAAIPAGGKPTRDDAPDTAGMSPHQLVRLGLEQRARK